MGTESSNGNEERTNSARLLLIGNPLAANRLNIGCSKQSYTKIRSAIVIGSGCPFRVTGLCRVWEYIVNVCPTIYSLRM